MDERTKEWIDMLEEASGLGRSETMDEQTKERAWNAWRDGMIESVRNLVAKFPFIARSEEMEDLVGLLELGPILIDWEKFSEAMDRDDLMRKRIGLTRSQWEKIKKQ